MVMEERLKSKRLYKATIGVLKVIPMLLALCAVLNMFFDSFNIDSGVLSIIGGVSLLPLLFLYLASFAFQFCIYHRMFLRYVLINNILNGIDYYIGLPVSNDFLFMIHLFLIGLFLFLILYFYRREKCCK